MTSSWASDWQEKEKQEEALLIQAQKKEKKLLKDLKNIATKIEKKRLQIKLFQEEIAEKEKELQKLLQYQKEKSRDFQKLEKRLYNRLLLLGLTGKIGWANLLFSPGDINLFLRRSTYLQILLTHDQTLAHTVKEEQKDILQRKQEIIQEEHKLSTLKAQLNRDIASLEALRQEKLLLLEEVRHNIALYKETLSYLREAYRSIEKLAQEVAATQREIQKVEQTIKKSPKAWTPSYKSWKDISLLEKKGTLSPPVKGEVTRLFGLYKDPITGEKLYQPGIFIRAKSGSLVRAPWGGKIKKIAVVRGQGKSIFIDHGQGFVSVIGGLGKIEVALGEEIKPEEVIGEVGEPPFSEAGIYYELRYKDKPQNPLDWLDIKKLRFPR